MTFDRRDLLKFTAAAATAAAMPAGFAQPAGAALPGIDARDRVFITNEDSNTLW